MNDQDKAIHNMLKSLGYGESKRGYTTTKMVTDFKRTNPAAFIGVEVANKEELRLHIANLYKHVDIIEWV